MATTLFTAKLRSVGNPDFGQYAPVSDRAVIEDITLQGILKKIEEYRERWNLGGGNWVEPKIMQGKKVIGWVSYNGRVWDRPGHRCSYLGDDKPVEILVGRNA